MPRDGDDFLTQEGRGGDGGGEVESFFFIFSLFVFLDFLIEDFRF